MNGEEKIRNQKLWYARIEEMLSSDISQKQWCQNNGININSMYYWLRSKDHAKIKALKWDADGFVLYYKRRERGTFQWPKNFRNDDTDQIPRSDLNRLLSGLIMESYIKRRHFVTV
ncbi:IS66 family insertion sequence element accessory protein TnpA [Eubacterium sp. F2]|uniref:IS66 family insertion sequence element accessory protein TnpA n=1 Tax=Eubacterium sp. F2 TaxID=3381348 RepID=UPI0039083272